MASQTSALPDGSTLTKPAYTDSADIAVINTNMDKIVSNINAENQALLKDVFALKTGTDIPRNTDFNTLTTPGNYRVRSYSDSATMTNIPIARAGTLYVKNGMLESGANYIQQIYATFDNNIYIRYSENKGSTWSAWDQLALKSNVGNVVDLGTVTSFDITNRVANNIYHFQFAGSVTDNPFSNAGGHGYLYVNETNNYGIMVLYSNAGIQARRLQNGTYLQWKSVVAL